MKARARKWIIKLSGIAASLAVLVTAGSVSQGCWFMLYQPDIPEELR